MLLEVNPPSANPVSNDPPPALLVAEPPRPSAVKSVSEDCNERKYLSYEVFKLTYLTSWLAALWAQ